ncbi:DEAD/DEAH box helicase [Nocardia sp. NPDC003482]
MRDPLVRALERAGITSPFPIQTDTLPDSLAGRDVLGRGRTGSGKTLAFAIPTVARLAGGHRSLEGPRGLILAPTRELATQIATALEPLVLPYSMRVTTIFGGVSQQRQERALRQGVDIVVACPGRLEDLMRQRLISLDAVRITVIDEADHMADLGFLPGVTRILAATPADGQRLLFSATLDNGVDKLVKRFLPDAVRHSVDSAASPVTSMTHHVFEVANPEAKKDLVHTLASGTGRRILFMRTKHHARRLAKTLTAAGIPAVDLHGNLAQGARDRNLETFASGRAKVLVATDVAARGVHVDGVELVVHVDPPAEHKAYLHRSGRTARAGSAGDVVTIVLPDQRKDLATLLRKATITARPQQVTSASPEVLALVGEVAAAVAPTPPAPKPVRANGSANSGGSASRGSGAPRRPRAKNTRNPHGARTETARNSYAEGRSQGTRTETARNSHAQGARTDAARNSYAEGRSHGTRTEPARNSHADGRRTEPARNSYTKRTETPARGGNQRATQGHSAGNRTGAARNERRRATRSW